MDANNGTANWQYRTGKALRYLAAPLAKRDIVLHNGPVDGAAAYRLTGTLTSGYQELQKLRDHSHPSRRARIIADLEDHPFQVCDWWPEEVKHKHKSLIEPAREWLRFADLVTVTTPRLAGVVDGIKDDRLQQSVPKWRVLPNLVDPNDFTQVHPRDNDRDGLVILWYGSNSHYADLAQLAEPVERILAEFRGVRFVFWGCHLPPALAQLSEKYDERVRFKGWKPYKHFHKELARIRPDIGLCPLAEHPFNEAKSCCKFLELTLAGAATVVSGGPVYFPNSDGCALVARDSHDWYAGMKSLITKRRFRLGMVEMAREWVECSCAWGNERAMREWFNFFLEIAE
jgi:hypothetical protein